MAGKLRTPKLPPAYRRPGTPAFQYYAGYDAGFVEDLLAGLELQAGSVVADPWNGAGTTTSVASRRGFSAIGYDINPALVVLGKAKLLGPDVVESLDALTHQILDHADRTVGQVERVEDDPLEQWYTAGTAHRLRCIDYAIQHVLVRPDARLAFISEAALQQMSALAAAFFVVLFETARSFLGEFTTSNPTWIKAPGQGAGPKISVAATRIESRFRALERQLHGHLLPAEPQLWEALEREPAQIHLGSSSSIALDDDVIDATITSPPYCTRIDYAVLTRPELAVLGIGNDEKMRALRDAMIGSPTMWANAAEPTSEWGKTALAFLKQVEKHDSKASKTYYLRYFKQYFGSMFRSLQEIRRVSKPDAPCAIVVQDSYYKEVHNDLAAALMEMGRTVGWGTPERVDFHVSWNRARMNPKAREYRTSFKATESLVLLRP